MNNVTVFGLVVSNWSINYFDFNDTLFLLNSALVNTSHGSGLTNSNHGGPLSATALTSNTHGEGLTNSAHVAALTTNGLTDNTHAPGLSNNTHPTGLGNSSALPNSAPQVTGLSNSTHIVGSTTPGTVTVSSGVLTTGSTGTTGGGGGGSTHTTAQTQCPECGRIITGKLQFRLHTEKHMRDKVKREKGAYKCGQCGRGYVTATHLKQHIDMAHNNIGGIK